MEQKFQTGSVLFIKGLELLTQLIHYELVYTDRGEYSHFRMYLTSPQHRLSWAFYDVPDNIDDFNAFQSSWGKYKIYRVLPSSKILDDLIYFDEIYLGADVITLATGVDQEPNTVIKSSCFNDYTTSAARLVNHKMFQNKYSAASANPLTNKSIKGKKETEAKKIKESLSALKNDAYYLRFREWLNQEPF